MNNSASIIHRALEREREKFSSGIVLSFTTLMHPGGRFGHRPRTIGLIELEDGRRVFGALLTKAPFIGQRVRPRMRLSHVTEDGLRVYGVAYEALVGATILKEFPGYILALTGPSGVGKSTISRMLAQACYQYAAAVPILTTRDPKQGDESEYVHTTPKEFDSLLRAGSIVAATRTPSKDERRQYGYRAADIEAIWKIGKVPIVIIEMHLLQDLAHYYGRRSILSFGLLPPGKSRRAKLSQLLHRLRARGRESEEHISDRLKNAERDLAFFEERKDLFDHIEVNADLPSLIISLKKKVPALSGA